MRLFLSAFASFRVWLMSMEIRAMLPGEVGSDGEVDTGSGRAKALKVHALFLPCVSLRDSGKIHGLLT